MNAPTFNITVAPSIRAMSGKSGRKTPARTYPTHPDFAMTADQRSEAYFLTKRLSVAIDPLAGKPWRVRRAKMLRARISGHVRANSRAHFSAFMRDWREAILSELRSLELPCAALQGGFR